MQKESKMGFARRHLAKSDDEILKLAKRAGLELKAQDIWNARNYQTALSRTARKTRKNGKMKSNGHKAKTNGHDHRVDTAAALPKALVSGLDGGGNVADLVQLRTQLVEEHREQLGAVDRVLALIKRRT